MTPKEATISKYIPSWEGPHTEGLFKKYPLQLISPHPRFSYHTHMDAKDSFVNDVKDHRILINGYYYWIVRINTKDARDREIEDKDLVKMFNDRGAVILAVQVTERVRQGVVHSYSSARYDPLGEPGYSADRGGCINQLTPSRTLIQKSHGVASNSCLVQIEKWVKGRVKMKKWHLMIDVEKCEDCNNCFLACKDEHVENDWTGYSVAQPSTAIDG